MSGDRIFLRNLYFWGHHGVLDFEKSRGQTFVVDIGLYLDLSAAGCNDQLEDTVDYSEVYKRIEIFMSEKTFRLLEALAESVCRRLLEEFPRLDGVWIHLRKLETPMLSAVQPMSSIGIEMTRLRGRTEP